MAAVVPDEFVEHTTAAALEEKAKLQKHFGRFVAAVQSVLYRLSNPIWLGGTLADPARPGVLRGGLEDESPGGRCQNRGSRPGGGQDAICAVI
jgi:hypothetical protein